MIMMVRTMKKGLIFLGLGLSLLALASCNKDANSKDNYIEKEINVYYSNSTKKHLIKEYKNIPYLGIKDYYKLLLNNSSSKDISDLKITKENDVYKVETPRGCDAYLNVSENTLYSKNLADFTNTSSFTKEYQSCYDGLPFIKLKSQTSKDDATPTSIDFDDYNIDIFGDDNDVYLPIPTLGDIFTGMNILYSVYNMKDLYIMDEGAETSLTEVFKDYNDNLFSIELNKDYMEYAFNEYCLFYDHFLERTGRTGLEKTYDNLSDGLAKVLESDRFGKKLKKDLTSTNIANYLAGINILGQLVYDGGHTVYSASNCVLGKEGVVKWLTPEIESQMTLIQEGYAGFEAFNRSDRSTNYFSKIRRTRQEQLNKENQKLVGEEAYTEFNDIAMISIDDYMTEYGNRDKWSKYYNHELSSIPYGEKEGGAVAALYKGFERAHQNPNIKTVIIDLGANSGGSTDELMYLVNFLTGNDTLYYKNQLTNQLIETTYYIDKNLDTVFDENDINYDPVGDLNVVVLTSESSFSCGGISPIYLHDLGIKVIGENCGGGSCAIVYRADALGIINVAGTYFNIVSPNNKENIDNERSHVCDYFITKEQNNDYSNFYDIDYLTNLINDEL